MSYSLIVNSTNRIASSASVNDATYYFDWAAFEEGKYKVSWSIYRSPSSPTLFETLLTTKAPWGRYSAASWIAGTNTLIDLTGNGRHATTSGVASGTAAGNGAAANVAFIGGSVDATVLWPAGSIPATFTIASVTRYATAGAKQRILNGSSINFLQGHCATWRGVFYNGAWWNQTSIGTNTDWLGMVATNGVTVAAPNNLLVDGVARAAANGGVGGNGALPDLRINGPGQSAEPSDFQFSQLIIWNQALTAAEMVVVSGALTNYLATGVLQ